VIVIARLRIAAVAGPSMVPALKHGDRVLVRMPGQRRRTPDLGSIVLVDLPDRPLSVKRLIAVEPDGRIWIEGDNTFASTDSRTLGSQPGGALHGEVLFRLWPRPGRIPPLEQPA
jgi:nickel-type superoxide dismutase maturation protease